MNADNGNGTPDPAADAEAVKKLDRDKPEVARDARLIDEVGQRIDDVRDEFMSSAERPSWDGFVSHVTGVERILLQQLINFRTLAFLAEERGEKVESGRQMQELTLKLANEEGGMERHRMVLSVYAEGIVFGYLMARKRQRAYVGSDSGVITPEIEREDAVVAQFDANGTPINRVSISLATLEQLQGGDAAAMAARDAAIMAEQVKGPSGISTAAPTPDLTEVPGVERYSVPGGIPLGIVAIYEDGDDVPEGMMKPEGQALRKDEYPELYAVLKGLEPTDTYQFGEDEETFNLPDFRNSVDGTVGHLRIRVK